MDKDSRTLLYRIYHDGGYDMKDYIGIRDSIYFWALEGIGPWAYVKLLAKELFDQGYFDTRSGKFEANDKEQAFNFTMNLQGLRAVNKIIEERSIDDFSDEDL